VRWVEHDPHRAGFLDRALLEALGTRLRGTRWLDAGCGEGRVARALAQKGATVLGVDVAAPLIAAARRSTRALAAAVRGRLTFATGDLAARGLLPRGELDGVVCALALMHVARPGPALEAWARALKPGGRLVLLLPHPCFMGPGTSWTARLPQVPRGPARPLALEVSDYPVRGVQRFRFDPAFPAATTNYHHSLEALSGELARAGFAIDRLGEPRPSAALVAREPSFAPYARVPFFLLVEARTR
jgi:SAM-dependent methyltransferase